jgi:hypothetical protein
MNRGKKGNGIFMASIMASTWIPGDQRKLSSLITSLLTGMVEL